MQNEKEITNFKYQNLNTWCSSTFPLTNYSESSFYFLSRAAWNLGPWSWISFAQKPPTWEIISNDAPKVEHYAKCSTSGCNRTSQSAPLR